MAANTRKEPPWRSRTFLRYVEYERVAWRDTVLATVVQTPRLRRWMANCAPSWAGRSLPEKRTIAPREVRRTRLAPAPTLGATPTVTTGLGTFGFWGRNTRNCVLR